MRATGLGVSGLPQSFPVTAPRAPSSHLLSPCDQKREARLHSRESENQALYEVCHPQFLRCHCVTSTSVGDATILDILTETAAPEVCQIQQDTQAVRPGELQRRFLNYWHPIWWRDSKAQSTELQQWPLFLQNLPPKPPQARALQLPLDDIETWEKALKGLNHRKATGHDSFPPARGTQILSGETPSRPHRSLPGRCQSWISNSLRTGKGL